MRWVPDLGRLIRALVRGEDIAGEIDAEIQFHLESRAAVLRDAGMTDEQALREARRRFGNIDRVRRECEAIGERRVHERRRASRLDGLRRDLLLAARSLRRNPVFALVVVTTLALGIGANTAILAVVRGILVRPLPYENADRLAALWLEFRPEDGGPGREIVASEPEYLELRAATRTFAGIAAYWTGEVNVGGIVEPLRVPAAAVSANFLRVLGASPILGRDFAEGEDRPGTESVIILGDGLWRRALGGSRDAVGSTIPVNGRPATIIGVLPASFVFPDGDAEILQLNRVDPANPAGRSSHYLSMLGRLEPDATLEQARAELATLTARWNAEFPDRHGPSDHHPIVMTGLRERIVGDVRQQLYIVSGAVALVLLIACVNVANLMLARTENRHREIGIRAALGAGKTRLVAQMMTESALVALIGGGAGVVLATLGVRFLIGIGPEALPRLEAVRVDGVVLGFALALSLATGLLFGLLPALLGARNHPAAAVKEGGPTGTVGAKRMIVRRLLVAGEVGLAVMLLVGAGLLVKSFVRLQQVDAGFRYDGVVTMDFSLTSARYPTPRDLARFHAELDRRVRALPGIRGAGAVRALPLRGAPGWETVSLTGARTPDAQGGGVAQYQVVSPGYFEALSIPLLAGRRFTEDDRVDAAPVAIINETMARLYWPDWDPLRERVQLGNWPGNTNPEMTIVGIVADVLQTGLSGEHIPQLYVPRPQAGAYYNGLGTRFATYAVRSDTDPISTIRAVRAVIRDLDPDLPLANVQTMERVVARSLADTRFTSLLMTIFSAVALILGAVGIYGLMAYTVAQRTREIGLRMALGADRARVLWGVVRQGMVLTLLGLTAGLALAWGIGKIVAGLVFEVSVRDPLVFAGAPLLLLAVALLAAYLPARRAAAVDPMVAIRAE